MDQWIGMWFIVLGDIVLLSVALGLFYLDKEDKDEDCNSD